MIKKEISTNLYQYSFSKNGGFEYNIIACIHNQKALLIDTGYTEHAEAVKKDLQSMSVDVDVIIWSHCHEDHIVGTALFPEAKIYAGKFYEQNYKMNLTEHPQLEQCVPQHIFDHIDHVNESFSFGPFDIRSHHTPGHSVCSNTTVITTSDNKKIMHVADLIIFSEDKRAAIPYVLTASEHIDSLNRLLEIDADIMVMGHGDPIKGKTDIQNAVDNRLYYLQKLLDSKGTLPLAECLKGDIDSYSYHNFHDSNVATLKK